MTMSRAHFQMIARVLAETMPENPCPSEAFADHVAQRFADELAASNPRFDRERFLAACKAPKKG